MALVASPLLPQPARAQAAARTARDEFVLIAISFTHRLRVQARIETQWRTSAVIARKRKP
jgi:hypothetical protein